MIIDCISDLHGFYPTLEGGDLLIVAGDYTSCNRVSEWKVFYEWLEAQNYHKKVYIGGNHDGFLTQCCSLEDPKHSFLKQLDEYNKSIPVYLCDSGTEFEYYDEKFPEEDEGFLPSGRRNLKIWGSPWTLNFEGQNPHCKAFGVDSEYELNDHFNLIPKDVDILITHTPPYGILDRVQHYESSKRVGSTSLRNHLYGERIKPKLHVFGHIHEGYGHIPKMMDFPHTQFVNASIMDRAYNPVNKPIRIVL